MSDKQFPQKYKKKLETFAPEYSDAVDSANTEDIKKFILTSEQNVYDIEHEIENNANLLKLKEELKRDVAPYNEAKQTEISKIKYCLHVLDQRAVKL